MIHALVCITKLSCPWEVQGSARKKHKSCLKLETRSSKCKTRNLILNSWKHQGSRIEDLGSRTEFRVETVNLHLKANVYTWLYMYICTIYRLGQVTWKFPACSKLQFVSASYYHLFERKFNAHHHEVHIFSLYMRFSFFTLILYRRSDQTMIS